MINEVQFLSRCKLCFLPRKDGEKQDFELISGFVPTEILKRIWYFSVYGHVIRIILSASSTSRAQEYEPIVNLVTFKEQEIS